MGSKVVTIRRYSPQKVRRCETFRGIYTSCSARDPRYLSGLSSIPAPRTNDTDDVHPRYKNNESLIYCGLYHELSKQVNDSNQNLLVSLHWQWPSDRIALFHINKSVVLLLWETFTASRVMDPFLFLSEALAELLIHLNDTITPAVSLRLSILVTAIETERLRYARSGIGCCLGDSYIFSESSWLQGCSHAGEWNRFLNLCD
jgi:hypothetical protein